MTEGRVRTLLCAYCRLERPMDAMKQVKKHGEEFWVCREECRKPV